MAEKIRRQNIGMTMHGKVDGYIEYTNIQDPPAVSFEVVLKNHKVARLSIIGYLTRKRNFFIPFRSDITDQYREETHVPTENIDLFEQSLLTLGSRIGVFLIK